MSSQAQFRWYVGLFGLGLLWVVSEVVGDGEKPGPLENASKSIAHRVAAQAGENSPEGGHPYELAVTQAAASDEAEGPAEPNEGDVNPVAPEPGAASNPWAIGASSTATQPAADEPADAGPDVGVIHK